MAGVRWLSEEEQRTWRAYLLMTQLLDATLDRQLQRDADLPLTYFGILVHLSEAEGGSLRMTDLARALHYSPSRLTHAVASLERRGWVERRPCEDDKRGHLAHLTGAGRVALADAAPGHVATVRAHLFDRLDADQRVQFRALCEEILKGFEEYRDGVRSR